MRRILAFSFLVLVAVSSTARAAESSIDFETAKAQAAERGVPVVIDFFTDWCIYCKHFDRDLADASTGLAEALEAVVFTSIDAEKGEGIELAKKYEVKGFPTYLMIDAEGELIDRWAGYGGPDHFREYYDRAIDDPRPLVVKRAEFEESPTAALAQRFGELEMAAGRNDEAIALFRQARELDPETDQSQNILYALFGKTRRAGGDPAAYEEFVEQAKALVDGAPTATVVAAAQMVAVAARGIDDPEAEIPFLKAALEAVQRDPADLDPDQITSIRMAAYLKVTKDVDAAVALRKSMLDEGWQEDPDALNSFAWWCFENGVNLEEAQELALHGVELARPGKQRAMILDTAAEICNALGNCGQALALIDRALEDDPSSKHYEQQRERFTELVAAQDTADDE